MGSPAFFPVKYGRIVGTTLEKYLQVDEKDKRVKPKKHLPVYTCIYR